MKKLLIALPIVVLLAAGCNKANTNMNTNTDNTNSQSSAASENANTNDQTSSGTIPATPATPANPGESSATPATPATPAVKQVSATISNFAFSPATITVKKGSVVTWTNKDSMAHTVTGTNGGPASGSIAQNATYSYTFNTVGTFQYYCKFHPNMKGTVVVTE